MDSDPLRLEQMGPIESIGPVADKWAVATMNRTLLYDPMREVGHDE